MSETRLEKIYTKFKDMKKDAEKDIVFNQSNMTGAFNIANVLVKWINQKTEWQRVYRDLEVKRKNAYRKAYEFYVKDFPLKLNNKSEYEMFIESDPNYVDIHNECLTVKEILQFIDATMDAVKQKGYQVKMFIEWQKFKNGQ